MSFYLLLGFLFAGILHVLVPQQLFSKYLSQNNWVSVLYATLFGREGASKGSVIAFLIATPQTGVDSIIATYSLLGLPFAIIRPIVALFTAMFAGLTTNIFTSQQNVTPVQVAEQKQETQLSFIQKLKRIFQYGYVEMMEDIGKMLLFGLIVAGLIAYFVPDNFFMMFGHNTILTMLLVLLVAVPMYVCATGSIPIAIALMLKGMSPGTALVLLMAGPAANIASMLVIGKVLGKKTFALYLTTLVIGAIASGLIIDNFLPAGWFDVSNFTMTAHQHGHFYCFKVICSVILLALFINAMLLKKHREQAKVANDTDLVKATVFRIDGMNCNHCKVNVTNAIGKLKSVKKVTVNVSEGKAYVQGNPTDEEIKEAVEKIGFEFKGRI